MLRIESIGQPSQGTVIDVLAHANQDPDYKRLRAAVAYATHSGIRTLMGSGVLINSSLVKQWLVAIDWCRSEPSAIDALDTSPKSIARVPFGTEIVKSPRCTPRTSFHPKGFLFLGEEARLLVSGSANVSRNGLSIGHELDTIIEVKNPRTSAEKHAWVALENTNSWFLRLWKSADPYAQISGEYELVHADSIREPVPTSDDATNAPRPTHSSQFKPQELAKIRAAQRLWIESGKVTRNRGPKLAGNQIMMRAMTRVFFGVPAQDVPRDSFLASLTIGYQGHHSEDRTLRYSNNAMDVLTVPVPGGATGPPSYDKQTLVLTKMSAQGGLVYDLRIATPQEKRSLVQRSKKIGAYFEMRSGRKFGVV